MKKPDNTRLPRFDQLLRMIGSPSYFRTDKGLFITTGRFTTDARKEATRDGAPPVELIDGEELCNLLRELKIGVSIAIVEKVVVHDELFSTI